MRRLDAVLSSLKNNTVVGLDEFEPALRLVRTALCKVMANGPCSVVLLSAICLFVASELAGQARELPTCS